MTTFIRLLKSNNKPGNLLDSVNCFRSGKYNTFLKDVDHNSFSCIPGSPFAYWLSDSLREAFNTIPPFQSEGRVTKQGLATADDFRFARLWWEPNSSRMYERWFPFLKGGGYSPFYSDIPLVVGYSKADQTGYMTIGRFGRGATHYYRSGISWPSRPHRRGTFSVVPKGAIFSVSGMMLFQDSEEQLLVTCALLNSSAYLGLLHSIMPRGADGSGQTLKYELVYLSAIPVPIVESAKREELKKLVLKGWEIGRHKDKIDETSHAFVAPLTLISRVLNVDLTHLTSEISCIQNSIDSIAFDLYGFSVEDRNLVLEWLGNGSGIVKEDVESLAVNTSELKSDEISSLLSWSVGVSAGRFDWRIVNGELEVPKDPQPFDPLPAKSPGMLPDGAEPFHLHAGILTDDEGHQHDLPRLIEQVLETVDAPVSQDIRRWLRKDFFPFHLQQYSKSRRKAPIYWPLSTASGSYTLWLYYPELTNQTLFTAVNDFVEPKLNSVSDDLNGLRTKGGGRSKQEEKELEKLEDLEHELADLRDTLLEIAPNYRPNQDDGVQITAVPLWSLFRHKPWQKVLKDTWKQLEKGDYDWAHLALNYWPDRVLRKCHEDRSLAIAHDVEELFWEEIEVPVIRRGKETGETKLEWQPKDLSEAQLQALINQVRQERSL